MSKPKKILLTLLVVTSLYNTSISYAQNVEGIAYYREVFYTVDTLFCKPKSNRLMICGGGQMDVHGDASGINYGPYLYARLNVSRFILSGVVAGTAIGSNTEYNTQEFTGVFSFKGSSSVKKGDKVVATTQDVGREPTLFKTGGTFQYVSPQEWTATSVSYDTQYYGPTSSYPGGSEVTTKTTTTTSGTSNMIDTRKSDAYLMVPTYTVAGLSAGFFNWTRPNSISGVTHVQGISFGLVACINKKAKYRFHYTEKINDVTILGLGSYTQTPTNKTGKTGTKIGRTNRSVDLGLEFLLGTSIKFDSTQYLVTTDTDPIGTYQDIKKKNFGFRIRMETRQGPISLRYELGIRPGVSARIGGSAGEDNFFTRRMGGAYILFGVGFGIGLL